MDYPREILDAAHRHSSNHRAEIGRSEICGCFYCCRTFKPGEIAEWIDDKLWTAHCPHCWIDSVLGSASGYPVAEPEFLRAMHTRWFS